MFLSVINLLEDLSQISVAHVSRTESHDTYSPLTTTGRPWRTMPMSLDMVDLVWSQMKTGELYSPDDITNILGQPTDLIVRVLDFLARYKFAEQMSKRELIFRKIPNGPSPGDALKILQMLRSNVALNNAGRVANSSRVPRRLNLT